MTAKRPHITICICTLQRPALLAALLERAAEQATGGRFTFSIAVADNDSARSAEGIVAAFADRTGIATAYCCEPRKNIALARNAALDLATGDFAAFIDDDECPEVDWLAKLLETCERDKAAGVLGPVRPRYEEEPPRWVVDGGFWERPEYPTGRTMRGEECRTGNVLLRRATFMGDAQPFDPQFGTGGEDVDFFIRMTGRGHVYRWCNEAPVYETVPRDRCTRRYMIRRAMLRGRNTARRSSGRLPLIAKSLVAAPLYLAALPFTLPLGQHVFMRYCIKLCDHAGRLLALAGLNPVQSR